MVSTAIHTLVRLAAFVAVFLLFQQGVITAADDDPLGTGLLAFAAFLVVSGVWGLVDGWFFSIGRLIGIWLVVGVAMTVAIPLINQFPDGLDAGVLLSDVLTGLALFVGLIAVPAIVAGTVVALVRPPRPAPLR